MAVHNLPTQPTPFVGRTQDRAEITALLADPACHLLTLVGPGGIGKTRLALEATMQMEIYPDGVHFVALQPLTSPDHIVSAIASAVSFQFYPGGEPKQQLLNYLSKKHLLLLLDNFEHLLDGADFVSEVLATAPGVQIIVTSRERLNLTSETVFTVSGLRIPDSDTADDPLDYSAVKLFLQSARRIRPNFGVQDDDLKHVARICRLVGGMPLAILLAAVWVDMLSLQEIAAEIEHSLEFLETEMRDLPERHRSVRATFDYSWGRLSETEHDVFKKLSVFRGGFSREAAKEVAGASLKVLMGLVNKSFVQAVGSGRYDIHELLRQYGAVFLNSNDNESNTAKALHCAYYAEFTRQHHVDFEGSNWKAALQAFSGDYENIRKAWDEAVEQARWDDLWKMSHSFMEFSYHINRLQDAFNLYVQAVTKIQEVEAEQKDDELFVVLVAHAGFMSAALSTDFDTSLYQRAVTIIKKLTPSNAISVHSLSLLGFYGAHKVDLSEGEQLMRRSIALCQERNYTFELVGSIICLIATFSNLAINLAEIKTLAEEAFDLVMQLNNPYWMSYVQRHKGQVLMLEGDFSAAKPLIEESCRNFLKYGDRINALSCQLSLAVMAHQEGDYAEAFHQYKQLLVFYNETTNPFAITMILDGIAKTLVAQGKRERAVELCHLIRNIEGITIGTPPDVASLLRQLEAELPSEVFAAAVEHGKTLELDTTVQELLAELSQPDTAPITQALAELLTRRELEVLNRVAAGRSNREIATELFLSPGTVKWYLTEIYGKLAVNGRMQAVVRAKELNLLS